MVRDWQPKNLVDEVRILLNNIEKINTKRGLLIPRGEMAKFRLDQIPSDTYMRILQSTIEPENHELYQQLKKKTNKRAFKRLTNCTLSDVVKYGISVLEDEIFTNDNLNSLEDRYQTDIEKRERLADKFIEDQEKWLAEYKDWEDGKYKYTIMEDGQQKEINPPPPEPPKQPPIELPDDLDPIEWLIIVLKENGISFNKEFENELIEGVISDKDRINAVQKIDFCTTASFNELTQEYPKVAKKLMDNDLKQSRKGRKKKRAISGKDLFVRDFLDKNNSITMTQAIATWSALDKEEKTSWNDIASEWKE